ncbi:prepilin-type N-terminal cleavage/methylation domain-containing protein [Acidiluteibacter ferrifornacis]|uniref:Prepilin-type N-terminal cleavage/methylation domain-containing protein n=1 Tax=Acidiluteibacter ferrifornacis TaxID=2692424 RepID=A0A6N9NFV2_9FLAO|nr:prepilin-type N-terminal cleavage/methylation domain-containing protein [Acidiluteibacter ferrifornacis]NBG64753.1 prepilin-type N-terminal cleavage/methylation domain-containing protein [Acidiluteibacter ferrifornacis]
MGRNFKAKLNGFTLLELLIALAISAIVITAGYTALHLTADLFHNNSEHNSQNVMLLQSNYLLQKDFFEAHLIYIEGNELKFFGKDSINAIYDISEDFMIRNQKEGLDTFKFDEINYGFGFKGKAMNIGFIDSLTIVFKQEEEKRIILLKEYTAESLIDMNRRDNEF